MENKDNSEKLNSSLNIEQNIPQIIRNEKNQLSNLEKEKEIVPSTEALYHYCFDIDENSLIKYGLENEKIQHFKTIIITSLADKIARELKDNWLIVHGNEKHVLVYDEEKNSKETEDNIITYYIKTDHIPEDTLYLGNKGLELFSKSMEKIERHKLRLEFFIQNLENILPSLITLENSNNKKELVESIELDKIIDYLDSLPSPPQQNYNKIKNS